MPYDPAKKSSLPEYVQAYPAAQRRQWAHIWNGAYARCTRTGGTKNACEASAFRQANGVLKKERAS